MCVCSQSSLKNNVVTSWGLTWLQASEALSNPHTCLSSITLYLGQLYLYLIRETLIYSWQGVCACVCVWLWLRLPSGRISAAWPFHLGQRGQKQSENSWFLAQWERLGFGSGRKKVILVLLKLLNPNLGDKIPCFPNVPLRGGLVVSQSGDIVSVQVQSEQLMKESFPWSEGQIQIWLVLILKVPIL